MISVGGTSFKRYMELANILGVRVAVIRDNDRDYQWNCVENYEDHVSDSIKVFSDTDPERYTFEVCIYHDNKDICDALFSGGGIKKEPLHYMLDNKTEAAFRLIDEHSENIEVPGYIMQAFQWINE